MNEIEQLRSQANYWFEYGDQRTASAYMLEALALEARGNSTMTPEQFAAWLDEMKSAGLARSDAECARLLGKSDDTIISYKKKGTDRTVALACRALLHRLEPYASWKEASVRWRG